MSEDKAKRELLKDKVVDLVRTFIKTEGGITPYDLEALFGPISPVCQVNEVANALAVKPISLA
jgi:hypothetical protein